MSSKKTAAADIGSAYQVEKPEEFARNLLRLMEESGAVLTGMLEQAEKSKGPFSSSGEMSEGARSMGEVAQQWISQPAKLAEAQGALMGGYVDLWNNSMRRMFGADAASVVEPEPGDNRFKDPEWNTNPYFDFWKQAYLLTANWAEDLVQQTDGVDERTKKRADFFLLQMSSALSPSNFPLTNPEVMRETLKSNGANLVEGTQNLLKDMKASGDLLKISQSDLKAFEIGRNLAVTPGKVVYQNDIMQLIQYAPSTAKVHETPLLVVPPWINKYYILDLTAPKSYIKYIVDQGFTVFIVSWVNPDQSLADKTFVDYMKEGILEAAEAVRRETGVDHINALGYCVGGTLLATALAYLAGRGEQPFTSATFLAAQVDFTKAGDLLLFIDDDQLSALEEMMAERGFLDGSRMANVFNMLRPKDLIWPYIVNNYLLGRQPMPFDLLYWNQDSTRMPAANHNYYLREFYHENALAAGAMQIDGTTLDLGKIKLPIYELATREDHIAPAQSVLTGARMFGGPVEFVLSGSGHIAGVVNPPAKTKYQYWTSRKKTGDLDVWLSGASENPGSWWPHWTTWLTRHAGPRIEPRVPGAKLGVIEDAPGSYVRAKG